MLRKPDNAPGAEKLSLSYLQTKMPADCLEWQIRSQRAVGAEGVVVVAVAVAAAVASTLVLAVVVLVAIVVVLVVVVAAVALVCRLRPHCLNAYLRASPPRQLFLHRRDWKGTGECMRGSKISWTSKKLSRKSPRRTRRRSERLDNNRQRLLQLSGRVQHATLSCETQAKEGRAMVR